MKGQGQTGWAQGSWLSRVTDRLIKHKVFEEIFAFHVAGCSVLACNAHECFCHAPGPHPQKFLTTENPAMGLQLPAPSFRFFYTTVAHYSFGYLMNLSLEKEVSAMG